jgi:hypothetical protein
MMSLRGQSSWAKMTSLGGQANSTGMPPDQICKQSLVTNSSLYKHCVRHCNTYKDITCNDLIYNILKCGITYNGMYL